MSLILDALRKSEGQRQRHAGPALATVPEAPGERGAPRWTLVLGALLVVNALLVAALVFTDAPEPPAQPAPATRAAREPVTAPPPASRPAATRPVPLPPPTRAAREEVRPLEAEIPPAAPASGGAPVGGSPTASGPATQAPAPRPAPATAGSARAEEDARLPRMSELVVRGELNVPDMHLDIHVYSGNPAERFVFINMRKYKEGDPTREGPVVERISEAGVVMRHDGQRFVLPKD